MNWVNEKTLEANVGAELLTAMRCLPGMSRCYLRGLTQTEERRDGADFFLNRPNGTRVFVLQYKAVTGSRRLPDTPPYTFTLTYHQHEALLDLAGRHPGSVHYVLPFYRYYDKLVREIGALLKDTWCLDAGRVPMSALGGQRTKRITCEPHWAHVNPEYEMTTLAKLVGSREGPTELRLGEGIPAEAMHEWRSKSEAMFVEYGRPDRWLIPPSFTRGMRSLIVEPEQQ
jgi:hypothetical protein